MSRLIRVRYGPIELGRLRRVVWSSGLARDRPPVIANHPTALIPHATSQPDLDEPLGAPAGKWQARRLREERQARPDTS